MGFNTNQKALLAIDAAVNLLLGVLLLLFPTGLPELFGLPGASHHLYTTVLGAVIFGIGVALLVDLFGAAHGVRGLGLGGAIAINLCGGGALLWWLLLSPLDLPLRGHIILWVVAVVVLVIGIAELVTRSWKTR